MVSPFHDVPLHCNGSANADSGMFNMVVEVPRWSNAKLEICKYRSLNPIVQDIKKGKLRYVGNVFPFKGYVCNYGAFPQTWEDPTIVDSDTGHLGDNDPLDVCEIGSGIAATGQIQPVKVVGCLAMIDEGETDWKIIAIGENDPLFDKVNDIGDVTVHMPGYLHAIRLWFRNYKRPDGKPANHFAFEGEYQNREYALKVIKQAHESWKLLLEGKADGDLKIQV